MLVWTVDCCRAWLAIWEKLFNINGSNVKANLHGILLSSGASNTEHMVSELAKQLWRFTDLIWLSVQSSDTLHKCIKPAKKFEAFFIECSDWDEILFSVH